MCDDDIIGHPGIFSRKDKLNRSNPSLSNLDDKSNEIVTTPNSSSNESLNRATNHKAPNPDNITHRKPAK